MLCGTVLSMKKIAEQNVPRNDRDNQLKITAA